MKKHLLALALAVPFAFAPCPAPGQAPGEAVAPPAAPAVAPDAAAVAVPPDADAGSAPDAAAAKPSGTVETLLETLERVRARDGARDYVGALEALDRARAELVRKAHFQIRAAPLSLLSATLCKQVTRSGEPVPFLAPPRPGDELCLQVTIGGFNVAVRPRGGFVYHITLEGRLVGPGGREILSFGPVRQFNGVEEFLTRASLVKYVKIPENIPRGEYRLLFEAADQIGAGKRLTGEVSFRMGSSLELAPPPVPPVQVLPGASGVPPLPQDMDGAGEVEVETGE